MVMPSTQHVRDLVLALHEVAIVNGTSLENVPDPPESDPLRCEWLTFKREAYRLIAEGHKGRFALIKADEVVSVWDTRRDASQAGHERFGLEPFMIQEVQLYVRNVRSGYSRVCNS